MSVRVRREIIAWFWVGLVFLLVNGTIGQARVIPSASMENTLLIGDHLIISRVGYDAGLPFTNWHVPLWRNPKRQQIIIFRPPYAPDQTDLVKRAIGMPGDVVDLRDGNVWINGKQLKRITRRARPNQRRRDTLSAVESMSPSLTACLTIVILRWATTELILTTAASGVAFRANISSALR